MHGSHLQLGSVFLVESPDRTDSARKLLQSGGARTGLTYAECPVEAALSERRSRRMATLICSSRCQPFRSWTEVYRELARAAARPNFIIAAVANQEVWQSALLASSRGVHVLPADLDDLLCLLFAGHQPSKT